MKPILPKCSGASQMQGIYTSPRTTIILAHPAAAAPAVPLGTPLSSSLILPAPPTFSITLAAHQAPQPTPVILPLTKTTASSSSGQIQCALIAPKNSLPIVGLKDQQSSSVSIKGNGFKRDSCQRTKGKGDGRLKQKNSNFETPILPKRPQSEPKTVIFLPSAPDRKTSELAPPVLVPGCSLVITGDAYPQTTIRGKSISRNVKSVSEEEKFNEVNDMHQEKSLQVKHKPPKRYRNKTKTSWLKLLKKKNVDGQSSESSATSNFMSSYADAKSVREDSSFLARESVSSTYISEALSLRQSGHVPGQQDVPHHPPPPYPQNSGAKRVDSIAEQTKTKKGIQARKAQNDTPDPSTCGLRLLHIKRKKCEGKNKRHCVAEEFSHETNNLSTPKIRSDSSSNSNSSSLSNNHMPLYSSSATSIQPFPATSSTSSLSQTVGKISLSNTAETSSCPSPGVQSHPPHSKNRNSTPSVYESHTNHKGPPHDGHYSFSTSSSTTLEAQASHTTPVKSSPKKSCEYSYLLQPNSPGICVSVVPPISSQSSGSSSTQSVPHTSYCSQTPVVTNPSQSSICSLPSLYSDAHDASSSALPSSGGLSCEPKSGVGTVLPPASLHFSQSTQHSQASFSPHLDIGDQTQGSTFYSQSQQCTSILPSVLHSHPPNTSTETNFTSSSPFLSCMSSRNQTLEQKVSSHSDSPQQNAYPLQPTSYMESPQLISFKPPQAALMNSPQPPSYTQSSRSSVYSRPAEAALNAISYHLSSCVHPTPSAVRSQCIHPQYIKNPHSNQSPTSEQHASYLQPTQSLSLSNVGEHKVEPDHNSQGVSFSSAYTSSFHPSPQGQHQTQPPQIPSVSVENVSAIAMCKDNSQSPIPPPYAISGIVPSSSQYYSDSPTVSYTSERASTAYDSHYSSQGKLRPSSSSSSSLGVSSSHIIFERSLSPPSYEAHLKNSASYIASSGSTQISQDNLQHRCHHTSPTNYYSFSSQIVHGQRTQSLHEDAKKSINSNCSSSSPLLSLPPPPRYNYSQELTPEDHHIDNSLIADIAQGTYNYDIEESSESYFPATTTDTPLPLLSENQAQPSSSTEYRPSNSHINIHVAPQDVQDSNGVQARQQSSQSRILIYPLGREEAPCKNSDQDDLVFSNWSSLTQSTEHGDNLRVEKLWFIPHQEQNHVYMKESAKYSSNDQGLQSTKDLMLKKFWIEEDEPIAEEIISSLPCSRPQQQEEMVKDLEEKATLPQCPSPQYPMSKKNKTRQMLCQICGKMLKGHKSLRSHLNSHYNIQPHSCPTCAKKFTTRSVLVEHLRIHSGETPYLCSFCSAAFRTRSGLLKHRSMHTSARPFECSMCSKKFKTKLVLQQHMKLHLTGIFTCSDCGKTFERHRSLAVHKAFHHHKSQRFKCPHCPKVYHFQSLLNQHMQLHSSVQKHICTVCDRSFVWRSGLVAHMKTHSTSRPKCNICDMCFASEKRLKSHYQRHTNQKPHQCKVCGRNFPYAYRLASHSLIHEEHKEYRCKTCDIVFTNAKKFRKHLVTHKKEQKNCAVSGTIEGHKSVL